MRFNHADNLWWTTHRFETSLQNWRLRNITTFSISVPLIKKIMLSYYEVAAFPTRPSFVCSIQIPNSIGSNPTFTLKNNQPILDVSQCVINAHRADLSEIKPENNSLLRCLLHKSCVWSLSIFVAHRKCAHSNA